MLEQARQLLSQRILHNIALLKMIESYGPHIDCRLHQECGQSALLLLLPASLFPYDLIHYPNASAIAFLYATDPQLLPRLLGKLPDEGAIVFKIQDNRYKPYIAHRYAYERIRAFHSYSCTELPVPTRSTNTVIEGTMLNETLLPLWMANGYSKDELADLFRRGARSYTIYHDGQPASTCFTFRNYEHVWEIGGVHTGEACRGQGLAQQVAAAATQQLLSQGLIPRYQVIESNRASIRLAESLGFTLAVTLEHLYGRRLDVTGAFR
ncbi:putative GNAT family acetyltransferase [Paenibacillus phyllosphaerae]|uniref:Putative GNAT family acetyltransferase n=1 Tax=Paenibacillus phyllosphaerae TaxID=274593 RepID=A0A7W5B0W2_9BACL|nr:GNAT family N-acetyltransferase [Paenibacillus phyllosphaerae]MBB3111856.1 putative GNAT family acetyltransferase [Paenibacillus phyllosphaerae]